MSIYSVYEAELERSKNSENGFEEMAISTGIPSEICKILIKNVSNGDIIHLKTHGNS